MRIGNMGFWPSAVAGGFFILRGKRAGVGKNPAVTALPCQGPLGKRVMGEEGTDCHSRCAHRLRNDTFLRSAVGRDDVGSELSAAGGRESEVSEWPRSKF